MAASGVSQLALVNLVPDLELRFTRPSAINTILLKNGRPYLQICTPDPASVKTTVVNCTTKEVLSTTKHNTFSSDTVQFAHHYEGRTLKRKDWLVEERTNEGKRWAIETSAGRFIWRRDINLRLVLCPANDLSNPLVWVQHQPRALMLKNGIEPLHELILASYSLLEQQILFKEKAFAVSEGMADDEMGQMFVDPANFDKKR